MQEQVDTIYRPTVHVQRGLGFQIASQTIQAENKYYDEIKAVPCKAFSIV